MKGKLVWLLLPCLMVIALVMTSCGGNPALEVAEKWSAAMTDAMVNGNLDALDEVEDPDVVLHIAGMPDAVGLEQHKWVTSFIRETYPNFHAENMDITASGDTAAIRDTLSWTFSKEIPGYPPPTGEEVSYQCATFLHIKNGKVVEIFQVTDSMSAAQQLGLVPMMPYQQVSE